MKKSVLLPFLILILFGCNNTSNSISKDVNEDFWNDSKELVTMMENNILELSPLSKEQEQLFSRYEKDYFNNKSTDTEKDLFVDVVNLKQAYINYLSMLHPKTEELQNEYLDEYLNLLVKIEKRYNISVE